MLAKWLFSLGWTGEVRFKLFFFVCIYMKGRLVEGTARRKKLLEGAARRKKPVRAAGPKGKLVEGEVRRKRLLGAANLFREKRQRRIYMGEFNDSVYRCCMIWGLNNADRAAGLTGVVPKSTPTKERLSLFYKNATDKTTEALLTPDERAKLGGLFEQRRQAKARGENLGNSTGEILEIVRRTIIRFIEQEEKKQK